MTDYRPPQHDFGVSWGMRGFRVGRSQYGTWWVSVQLPFGFRITKRLGRLRDPRPDITLPEVIPGEVRPPLRQPAAALPAQPGLASRNQEILSRIKGQQP